MKIRIENIIVVFCSVPALVSADIKFSILYDEQAQAPQAVYLFAHGLGATREQAQELMAKLSPTEKQRHWIIAQPTASFDFADAKPGKSEFDHKKVCLGQGNDIEHLKKAYEYTQEKFPNTPIVLVGISRGAATILMFLALHQPEGVKAAILESPFDTLSSVIKHLLDRYCISWMPFSKQMADTICESYFPKIDLKGPFPVQVLNKIPANIPIVIIHSKKDKVIPIDSSRTIYAKLKNNGNAHSFIVELASGAHGKLLQGADAQLYFCTIQAFYKRYGLPHDSQAANQGDFFLNQCQPDPFKYRSVLEKDNDNESIVATF